MIPTHYKLALAALAAACIFFSGYRLGIKLERGEWESAARRQAHQAHRGEQKATVTSERIADESRTQAETDTQAAKSETTETVERIRYVYRTIPAACPDARNLPDSVRDDLDKARQALAASR
jgi:hypothetical protein